MVHQLMQDQIDYLRKQLDEEREANRENRRLLAALESNGCPSWRPHETHRMAL